MGRLFPLLFLADLALMVIALIDCLSVDEAAIRALPKIAWVLLILLFSPIGPIVWFVAGRPQAAGAASSGTSWAVGGGFPESSRRRRPAPDDDPEFLRSIDQRHGDDEELMRRWEQDLRRREEELRRRERGEQPPEATP